jgi:hypothetical protein
LFWAINGLLIVAIKIKEMEVTRQSKPGKNGLGKKPRFAIANYIFQAGLEKK